MPIPAYSNPVQTLIDIAPNVASALSRVGDIETDISNNIKPKTNSLESGLTAVNTKADDIETRRLQNELDNAAKFGTWDTKLQSEIGRIDGIINDVETNVKPKTNKMFSWLGVALDAADIAGFILDVVGLAALSAAIAEVGSNSVARDEYLQGLIDSLNQELDGLKAMIEQQLQTIINSQGGISTDINTLLNRSLALAAIQNQLSSIQSQSSSIFDISGDIFSVINLVKDDTTTIRNNTTGVLDYVDNIPQLSSDINAIIPAIPSKVCEALNSDCFDFPSGNATDISPVIDLLQDLGNRIGSGSGSCGDVYPVFGNLTDGLETLVCRGNDGIIDGLREYLEENPLNLSPVIQKVEDKGNEILDAIENIPEPTLYVPEEWAIKIEGNRPQLIAGMQDAANAGKGSASKWAIVIPHPKSSALNMEWDDLVGYFPPYTRGGWAAIAKLTDGSVVRVRANTKDKAGDYLDKMLELVNPSLLTGDPHLYQFNPKFKNVAVVCRGISYYATGRKQGEKPTKRWYYPIENDRPV